MRPPAYLTLILALMLAVFGFRNHRHAQALRDQHEQLAAKARESGWLVDERAPDGLVKPARATRPDPGSEARAVATALIVYARELPFPNDLPAAGRQRRITLETERVQGLDGNQLKSLIAELRAATDLPDLSRSNLLKFVLARLSQSHPRDAFEISMEMADPRSRLLDQTAEFMEFWANADPASARRWMDENPERLNDQNRDPLKRSLIQGAVIGDPRLALEWFAASASGSDVSSLISQRELTPSQRLAFLSAFRSWLTTPEGEALSPNERMTCLGTLTFGSYKVRKTSIAEVSAFWKDAKPKPQEIGELTRFDLASRIAPEDGVKFFEWIGQNLPEAEAATWRKALLRHSSTSPRIKDWLATQPGDMRDRWLSDERVADESPAEGGSHPVAKPVPGKAGFVFSPYNNRLVDVRGLPSGTLVKDPGMPAGQGGTFRVP